MRRWWVWFCGSFGSFGLASCCLCPLLVFYLFSFSLFLGGGARCWGGACLWVGRGFFIFTFILFYVLCGYWAGTCVRHEDRQSFSVSFPPPLSRLGRVFFPPWGGSVWGPLYLAVRAHLSSGSHMFREHFSPYSQGGGALWASQSVTRVLDFSRSGRGNSPLGGGMRSRIPPHRITSAW